MGSRHASSSRADQILVDPFTTEYSEGNELPLCRFCDGSWPADGMATGGEMIHEWDCPVPLAREVLRLTRKLSTPVVRRPPRLGRRLPKVELALTSEDLGFDDRTLKNAERWIGFAESASTGVRGHVEVVVAVAEPPPLTERAREWADAIVAAEPKRLRSAEISIRLGGEPLSPQKLAAAVRDPDILAALNEAARRLTGATA